MNRAYPLLRLNYKKSNGCYPIYLKVYISGTEKIYSLNISVLKENWLVRSREVSTKDSFSFKKNMIIGKATRKASDILFNFSLHGITATHELFENEMFEKRSVKKDYFQFAEKEIDLKKGVCSPGHLRQHKYELTKLRAFRNEVFLEDINYLFIQEYENYMRNTLSNKQNTVNKTFKKLKAILNIAIKKGSLKSNPFINYKLKNEKTYRVYLSPGELKALNNMYFNELENNKIRNVLRYFLFSCYTGLRYSDIIKLTWHNINNNEITLLQQKTGSMVNIPLSSFASDLLPEKTDRLFVFKTYSNQKVNDYLKIIALKASINKELTFHSARHTFATISLSLGISINTIKELLGHEDIKTTMIYAKLTNETKLKEMLQWKNF